MKKEKAKRPTILQMLGWRQVLICALCCVLFLGAILLNLSELMKLGRENAYRNCQNSYLLASREVSDFLRIADDAVGSAARRIEEMRAGGATASEILAYMYRETGNLDSKIAGSTTGVYGYIDGVYLDGTGWVPAPGYEPTQRPWYIGAAKAGGDVTHVPPFDNLQTGSLTITVCKLLSDGVSVVAMDLPTDNLQRIVNEAVLPDDYNTDGSSPYGYAQIFVMDTDGVVLAHSDETQILKNYVSSDDAIAREIARRIITEGKTYFQLENGEQPLVYCGGKLDDEWYIFAGLEYGEVVSRTMRSVYFSIGVAALGIAGMIFVMIRLSIRRYHAALIRDYATEVEEENQRLTEQAAAAAKIAELTQSVTALLTNMPGMTSSKDVKTGEYLACNQAFAEFANKERPQDVIGRTDREIFSEATVKKFAADDKKTLSMDAPYHFYEEVVDAAGNTRQFQSTKLKFTDTTGRLCTLCMRLDYTELMRVKQETAEARAAFEEAKSASAMHSSVAHALSSSYSYLYYVDLETDEYDDYSREIVDEALPESKRGHDFFNVSRAHARQLLHPDDLEEFLAAFTKENILLALEEDNSFVLTYRQLIGGEPVYVTMTVSRLQEDGLHILVGVSQNRDIDARNELTGLRTEVALHIRGKELLRAHPDGWCIICVDLEHFRLFNEWYGRDAGDQLLAQIGERLVRVEADTDGLTCYLGQDDFVLLVPYDEESVQRFFTDIHNCIMEHGTSVGFMPAIGVCMVDGKTSVEELYDRALQASQHAKEDYHHRVRIFEESMYQKTERDYQILSDFQQALQDRELFINLQPQCEIESGKVVGAESLVRWKKADGTMVSPGVFVPILEQYGFVTDLDQFVWEEVCAWQQKWIESGHTPLPVSINVSQIDIFTIDVPAYLELLVWKYKLPADVIKVEITESAYVGDGSVAETVKRLREKGFLVLMDDFGSGYSSLNMLRSLNVDVIKLDAMFLRMNSDDQRGVHILKSIVGMAKSMEAPIIVEGVETEEETEFIKNLGCRYVQGYHFYRPMPVADFETLIGDEKNISTAGFVNE